MSDQPGLLDTNVFIHAHTRDSLSEECRQFLLALEAGRVSAVIEPLILHELSYALPRYVKQMSHQDVAGYLLMVLSWDGILGDRAVLTDAVERWRDTPGLSFADAYLAALALMRRCPVYSKNVHELRGQGVQVPTPLLST
ncbi:MAG: PIN domain-containing protein [Chloroflexota bacterium]